MADADGKMRIEKCGWKKMRITKKSKKKKNEKCGWQKNYINKQTKERNISFKSLSHADGRCGWENEDKKNCEQ